MYRRPYRDPRKPPPIILPMTMTYLGEDERGYYYLEGFFDGLGNMFKRMVKFTPKSFTPGNLYKGFVNTALTTASFGAYQLLPKSIKKTVYDVGKVAIPVVAAGALAVWAAPGVVSALGSKLMSAGSLLGKAASTIGGQLFNRMQQLPPAQQQAVAEQVTPSQIVQMERTGVIPPDLQFLLDQQARQAFMPAAQRIMPGLTADMVQAQGAGVDPQQDELKRAQLADTGGFGMPIMLAGMGLAVVLVVMNQPVARPIRKR